VDGALLSAGDGHAAQGDGEVSQLAIEAPVERAQLTLSVRDDLSLTAPIAWTPEAWLTFGFDEDLDEAAALAVDGMLELMGREYGLERREALALAKRRRRLRVTQLVNGAQGIHAGSRTTPSTRRQSDAMSTWVVQVAIVAIFALVCGALAAAWMRGRLGIAAIALFTLAVVTWVAAFAAITARFHGADEFATCDSECSTGPLRLGHRIHRAAAPHLARGARDARVAR
jgi:hypothetical protein